MRRSREPGVGEGGNGVVRVRAGDSWPVAVMTLLHLHSNFYRIAFLGKIRITLTKPNLTLPLCTSFVHEIKIF